MLVYLKHGGRGEALILYVSKGRAHMSCAIHSSSDLRLWGEVRSMSEVTGGYLCCCKPLYA